MVISVLEAVVDPARVPDLERAYRDASLELTPGIVESFLSRNSQDGSEFRIVTVWKSREALEAMRASGETPKGIQVFHAAGARSRADVLDVIAHKHR